MFAWKFLKYVYIREKIYTRALSVVYNRMYMGRNEICCMYSYLLYLYSYFIFFKIEWDYSRGDSFPFDFEPNGNPFGSKSERKLSSRSHPIQYERKRKYSFLSVTYLRGGGHFGAADSALDNSAPCRFGTGHFGTVS